MIKGCFISLSGDIPTDISKEELVTLLFFIYIVLNIPIISFSSDFILNILVQCCVLNDPVTDYIQKLLRKKQR